MNRSNELMCSLFDRYSLCLMLSLFEHMLMMIDVKHLEHKVDRVIMMTMVRMLTLKVLMVIMMMNFD